MTDWLRGLGNYLHQQSQGPIGLIGMCITGNFALALCDEDWMEAPVLSQPSLPFAISPRHAAALHVSPDTLEKAKARPDLEVSGPTIYRGSNVSCCQISKFNKSVRRPF